MEVGFIYVSSNYKGMWMVGKTGGMHSSFLKNSVCIYEVAIFPNGGKHRYWLELWKPSMWVRSEERRNLKAFSSFIFLDSGKSLVFTFYIWTKCVYNLKVTYFQHEYLSPFYNPSPTSSHSLNLSNGREVIPSTKTVQLQRTVPKD